MTITAKQLADGQLAAAETDMYTAPASTSTYVKSIICSNTNASTANTVSIYLQPSAGTSRRIAYASLNPGDTLYIEEALVLDTGDKIRGLATNATQVDYTICGAEEA